MRRRPLTRVSRVSRPARAASTALDSGRDGLLGRLLVTLLFALGLLMLTATSLSAQDSGATGFLDRDDLNHAISEHESSAEADRKALDELLANPAVRDLAEVRGIDPNELAASAETLSDEEVSALAPLLERAAEAMRRNGTITVSVTTVIIILLLLILVT